VTYVQVREGLAQPPTASSVGAGPNLGVSARQLNEYDWAFVGPNGEKFKQLVTWAAAKVDINPGLLAENLIAETRRSDYLTSGKVSSFLVGTDDFFEKRRDLARKIPAYTEIKWDPRSRTTNINERGRRVTTIQFNSGRDAALASAVYLKHGEVMLQLAAKEANKDFASLPVEVRFALIRLAFNAGHARARKNLQDALEGKEILIRKPKKSAGPQRNATIHAARAAHLSEKVFGVPPK
jgi:hypothetical protein